MHINWIGKSSELKLHCFYLFDAYSLPKDMCSVFFLGFSDLSSALELSNRASSILQYILSDLTWLLSPLHSFTRIKKTCCFLFGLLVILWFNFDICQIGYYYTWVTYAIDGLNNKNYTLSHKNNSWELPQSRHE